MIRHIRPGDWAVMIAGIMLVAVLFVQVWGGGKGNTVVIRSAGKVVAEADLGHDRKFNIAGPLGTTEVSVEKGRVRVSRDPSPRQYCVKQGWLARAGESALCLPNQVAVELTGAGKIYDSLNY